LTIRVPGKVIMKNGNALFAMVIIAGFVLFAIAMIAIVGPYGLVQTIRTSLPGTT
jgi:hypothetical protein